MSQNKGKIVVGLSGGVDSSVAAYLLKKQGYEVIGLYMINWKDTEGTLYGTCPMEDDILVAKLVAHKLGIEFHTVDLSETYRARVVDYMFDEYSKGRTPNPDVLCNREIKFDAFIDAAAKYGSAKVATGHYCRCAKTIGADGSTQYSLLAGLDGNKDQSYFLCQLSQKQLSKAVFPIGELIKPEVRKIADELDLASAHKKDSQGICFVGKVDLPIFLQQKLKPKVGKIIEIPADFKAYNRIYPEELYPRLQKLAKPYFYRFKDGKVIGEHKGAHYYTIGQRKGLGIGGSEKPRFIISTDVKENLIFVGEGCNHKGLYRKALFIEKDEVHWIREDLELEMSKVNHKSHFKSDADSLGNNSLDSKSEVVEEKIFSRKYKVRIRYRQPLQNATLYRFEDGIYIDFDEPQKSITSGQFACWYDEKGELIGSGVIS